MSYAMCDAPVNRMSNACSPVAVGEVPRSVGMLCKEVLAARERAETLRDRLSSILRQGDTPSQTNGKLQQEPAYLWDKIDEQRVQIEHISGIISEILDRLQL